MRDLVDQALAKICEGTLASNCESLELDFKEDKGDASQLEASIAKTAICLANASGGKIVVGVCDKKSGTEAITGTKIDPEHLRQRLIELCKPPLLVDAEVREHVKRLIILTVHSGAVVYGDTTGRSWQRVKTNCFPLAPIDQARLAQERSGFDWSSERSSFSIDEIDSGALDAARDLLRRLPDDRRNLARLSKMDLLRALGVINDDGYLNNAGELLFCRSEANPLIVYQYKLTPGGEPRAIYRLSSPLTETFLKVMDVIVARQSTTPVAMQNGQQITIEDFPTIAVREAISNGICHRDWQIGGPVVVDHSPEIFSVISPGPLVTGVTPENILTIPSRPRNRCLTSAVRQLGLAEETGRGVDRMFRETIRSGRKPPTFDALPDHVRVSFSGGAPDTNIARFIARLPDAEREDTDTMIVLYHLCQVKNITAEIAAPLLQKPSLEADVVLRRLAVEPVMLLERSRHSLKRAKAVYRLREDAIRGLGSAISYNRRTVDEVDRKIIEHVREYTKITNRTLQNMFDIHVYKARDIIASLQERGMLVRVSETSRGPKVEWGPGPNFPRARSKGTRLAQGGKLPAAQTLKETPKALAGESCIDARQVELPLHRTLEK